MNQNWMRDYDPTTGRHLQADPLGLVDGASVYGYALQNPGRFVDPRGEYCVSMSGTTTCQSPGNYLVSFPTPDNWPNNSVMSPDGGTFGMYHFYDESVIKPGARFDVDCLLRELLAVPDLLPSNGASPGGTSNYANPAGFMDALGVNHVISYSFTDPVTGYNGVVNVTQPWHTLSPGIVVHLASPEGILTYGEGAGVLQSQYSPLAGTISGVW